MINHLVGRIVTLVCHVLLCICYRVRYRLGCNQYRQWSCSFDWWWSLASIYRLLSIHHPQRLFEFYIQDYLPTPPQSPLDHNTSTTIYLFE